MADPVFSLLLLVTVGLGLRTAAESFSVRDVLRWVLAALLLCVAALATFDFGLVQEAIRSDPGGLHGKLSPMSWANRSLPAGFGPGGMSLPPWQPINVDGATEQAMLLQTQAQIWQQQQ